MQKIIRNMRLVLLFLGYVFGVYMIDVFGIIKQVKMSDKYIWLVLGIGSVILVVMSILLTYLGKNGNSIYYIIYTAIVTTVMVGSNIKSEYLFFCMIIALILLSIICQYLHFFENKIESVKFKGADEKELINSYTKYIIALIGLMIIAFWIIVGGYKAIQILASSVVIYLYTDNIFFSIPAIGGFITITLICIFFLAMFFSKKEED